MTPRLGRVWIKPIPYGDSIEFYTNRERSVTTLVKLFRRSIVGLEDITYREMYHLLPWVPAELELAVIHASGLVDPETARSTTTGENPDTVDPTSGEAGTVVTRDGVEKQQVEAPDDSIWASHNRSARDQARETTENLNESDLIYGLHEHGETQESIYRMLIPEINTLFEGASRHAARQEEKAEKQQKQAKKQHKRGGTRRTSRRAGNRRDRARSIGTYRPDE